MINEQLLREDGKPAAVCVYVYRVVHPYNTWWVMEYNPRCPRGKKRYEASQQPHGSDFYKAMDVAFCLHLLPIFVRLNGRCRGFVRIEREEEDRDPPLLTARHNYLDWFASSCSPDSLSSSILRLMTVGPPHWCHRPEERAIELF